MSIDQLVFVGLGGYVVALDRDTGEIVWTTTMGGANVSLLLDGDRLIASRNGYIDCFDARTGRVLWHNPLKGYGLGVASLTSVRGQSSQAALQQAAAQQAAAVAASTAIQTSS
jgi:outer membrane protein assembly factor BamB